MKHAEDGLSPLRRRSFVQPCPEGRRASRNHFSDPDRALLAGLRLLLYCAPEFATFRARLALGGIG
jgi:hypothetical protein